MLTHTQNADCACKCIQCWFIFNYL